MKNLLLTILSILVAVPLLASPKRELVSMAVGRLQDRIVTSREVNANFYIESQLYGKKDKKFNGFYKVKSPEFAREVTAVLLEWVVFQESKGFAVANVSKADLESAQAKIRAKLKTDSRIKALQLTQEEVADIVSRKMRAKNFVRFKVDSSVVPITDDEARQYFEENRVKFGNLPFENFKDNIKAFLGRKQIDTRLKDWFDVLQNKYKVRNFLTEIE